MLARVLKKKEYWRLAGFDISKVADSLPKDSKIVVVEKDGEVIGTWSLVPYYHLECMEVKEGPRGKGKVARRLLRYMFGLLKSLEIPAAITSSVDPTVDEMIKKLGGKELPGKHFVVPSNYKEF